MIVLEPFDIYIGIEAIFITIISIAVSLKIFSKYFEYKNRSILFIGLAILFLGSRLWSRIVTFFSILISGNPIPSIYYFIIGYSISLPFIFSMSGVILMIDLKSINKKVIISLIFLSELIFSSIFYVFIFIDITLIGTYNPPYDVTPGIIIFVHSYYVFIVTAISITKMLLDAYKTHNREIQFKALFITIGLFFIGLNGVIKRYDFFSFLRSAFLLSGTFLVYIGLTFPKWIKNILMKKEREQE